MLKAKARRCWHATLFGFSLRFLLWRSFFYATSILSYVCLQFVQSCACVMASNSCIRVVVYSCVPSGQAQAA